MRFHCRYALFYRCSNLQKHCPISNYVFCKLHYFRAPFWAAPPSAPPPLPSCRVLWSAAVNWAFYLSSGDSGWWPPNPPKNRHSWRRDEKEKKLVWILFLRRRRLTTLWRLLPGCIRRGRNWSVQLFLTQKHKQKVKPPHRCNLQRMLTANSNTLR